MRRKNNNFLNYKREFFGFLLSIFSIFFLLSLVSYNITDNSLFYFSTDQKQIINWCGVLGANLSALTMYLFGSVSYLFLIFLSFFSYILIFAKNIKKEIFSIFAFVLLLISFTTFFRYFNLDFTQSYPGGFIGNSFLKIISKFFGPVGLNILLLIFVWASLMVLFKISFVNFFKTIFEFTYKTLKFLALKTYELLKFVFMKFLNLARKLFVFLFKFLKEKIKLLFNKIKDKRNKKLEKENSLIIYQENALQELQALQHLQDLANKIENNKTEQELVQDQNIYLNFSEQDKKQAPIEQKNIYNLPNVNMFQEAKQSQREVSELQEESSKRAEKLEEKLKHFGIKGKVVAIKPGPVITLYEYKPEIDSKISKIVSLEDDLAMALTALSIRIVAPIPGKSVVGFEIANQKRQNVLLQDIMLSEEFLQSNAKLPLGLGVDVVGKTVIGDLVSMPHLLVAGSTGSGKSVGMNVMLASLLCKLRPDQLKLILIDPKRLEFCPYADIPHLLFPIITNPRSAAPVLKWLVQEMEERYDKMAQNGVKNIIEYNNLAKDSQDLKTMPLIVLMIDELADLMMVAGKEIEIQITRIAQMARAAGIHMIVATQRPSVDVITGLIKVNFPSRIAFRVSSKIDSRTIIDSAGAEKLLGRGDMLYMNSGSSDLIRIHGAYISDKQIEKLTKHLKEQEKAKYLNLDEILIKQTTQSVEDFQDEIYSQVLEFLKKQDEISISMLQRQYRIGFNRSARIIEKLEADGIIAPAQGSKPRKVIR